MMEPLRPYHWAYDGLLPETPKATLLRDLLAKLVEMTGLTAISPAFVSVRSPDYAAFQIIAESHISIHGKGPQCWVDVFSCRPFQEDVVGRLLRDVLHGEWEYRQLRTEADGG